MTSQRRLVIVANGNANAYGRIASIVVDFRRTSTPLLISQNDAG